MTGIKTLSKLKPRRNKWRRTYWQSAKTLTGLKTLSGLDGDFYPEQVFFLKNLHILSG
jgi:hypothetical protein